MAAETARKKGSHSFVYKGFFLLALFSAVWATFGGFQRTGGSISPKDQQTVCLVASPVIKAIQAYKTDHARPPESLTALVPKYLPNVPKPPTPFSQAHDYLYTVEPSQWRLGVPLRGEKDGILTYSSLGDYPAGKPGTTVERVGAWAYYHGNPY